MVERTNKYESVKLVGVGELLHQFLSVSMGIYDILPPTRNYYNLLDNSNNTRQENPFTAKATTLIQ